MHQPPAFARNERQINSSLSALLLLALLSFGLQASPQELSYTHYTVKDGLPGSIVYQALQDKNGFIWFATSQGVSRFDGKIFKNFSKEDGLPDNDIIKLYLDRHNTMWFISFIGIPSFFCNGAIHRLDSCPGVVSITEDLLADSIFLITEYVKDGKEFRGFYQSANVAGHCHFSNHINTDAGASLSLPILQASSEKKSNFYFSLNGRRVCNLTVKDATNCHRYTFPCDSIMGYFSYKNKKLVELTPDKESILFYSKAALLLAGKTGLTCILSSNEMQLKYADLNFIFCENDSTLWLCTRNRGLTRIKNYLRPNKVIQSFLPKTFCTSILKDREGGYWVTTHNEGVYYLPNLDSYYMSGQGDQLVKDVKCIRKIDRHNLVAGFADGNILAMDYGSLQGKLLPHWGDANKNNRILDIQAYKPHQLLVISDYGLDLLFTDNNTNRKICNYGGIKCGFAMSDTAIAFGTTLGLFVLNPRTHYTADILMQRVICVTGMNHNYYCGTLKGMYEYSDNSVKYLGQPYPELSGIINHIDVAPDSAIWISTQQGILVLKNKHATVIRKQEGLLSDMCKQVSIESNIAWVSTDKGISRVAYRWDNSAPIYSISNIIENDGLRSSDINQTTIAGNHIWAATTGGICFFPKNYAPHSMEPPLINISTIVRGNNDAVTGDTVAIDYKKNKLLIGLSGISFRSGKQIRYQYRLKDLDSNWTNTATNLLEFSTLPFGTHTFEVKAIDRWGTKSTEVKKVVIVVRPPFWRTSWFTFFTYLLTAILIGWGAYSYFRWQSRKKDKEYQLKKKMADLEMMALRSQMNPHFIFNCLSSIQHYILRADVVNANLYLHKFSSLIRKILQYSTASDITLAEEFKILSLYLELEKLRMGERMEYTIRVEDDLLQAEISIPSMIIQPYVENAIKHGISPLQNKQGIVRIDFRHSDNYLVCTIDDNGIGIRESMQAANTGFPGYKSLGTNITENRIKIINAIQKGTMLLEITDKKEKGLNEDGTIVRISFPIENN